MLRARVIRFQAVRLSADEFKGKFGGFKDPWWSNSRFGGIDEYAIPGKEKDKFPFINDLGGPNRPMK